MNNINLTIEWCTEDRARIDRLTAALEKLAACDNCVQSALDYKAAVDDDLNQKLAETLARATVPESPKNAPEAPDDPTPPTAQAEPEPATPETPAAAPAPVREVKLADLQQKVVQLSTSGKKAEARAIVGEYTDPPKVSAIPADKYAEVLDKLNALETEVQA